MPQRPNDLRPWESREALFGSELRHYREAAGFSCLQLSQKIPYAKSTISAVERAESGCDRKMAVEADRALDARDALTRLWDGLFKGVGAVPTWFTDWFKREPDAMHIRSYQPLAVDGLLQTPAYATALLDGNEGAADTRMVRQKILTRSEPEPPNLLCVIDESVLYRDIGGRGVMRDQLGHLVALSSHRVRIQIVPCVQHGGLSGPFVIGTFAGGNEVAYRDGVLRGETTVDREDIIRLGEIFALIQAHAYPLGQSIELIKKVAAEKWS
ncbi:helix-turn-helix domain-containing protein [Spirillospora sp. NBC_01491]|uniref:helix-turn-helix domain-containing protein n=1 Tax=Spirillospora sp. NBC_01491 TaxID=2976007 RepID=UPI002E303C83|nr:helix-turn-helix transcriptional regulator [Spirillospora sp. NBC_01491]